MLKKIALSLRGKGDIPMKNSHSWGYIILQSPDLVRSRDKSNAIYLHLQKTHELGKLLTYLEIVSPLKPHYLFIMWSTWGHVTIWKSWIYFTRLTTTNLGKVLSYRRIFSTQMFKSSPNSGFLMIWKQGRETRKYGFVTIFILKFLRILEIERFKHLSVVSKLYYIFLKTLARYKTGLECVVVMFLCHVYKSQCVYSCLKFHCPKMKSSVSSGPGKSYFKW